VPRASEVRRGLVIRRTPLPSGDVVATLLSPEGKWRAIARRGKRIGGGVARLSLFHDVTVQVLLRPGDELALVTHVALTGALPGLTRPEAYPFAHLLAELADLLTPLDAGVDGAYRLLASGLRGLHGHHDPEAVALAYAWRQLALAGLAPDAAACDRCGAAPDALLPDVARARCRACRTSSTGNGSASDGALVLGEAALRDVARLARGSLSDAIADPPTERAAQWRALRGFVGEQVGIVNAWTSLPC
jgi:DNA repair protein RecO (recombination protein O)